MLKFICLGISLDVLAILVDCAGSKSIAMTTITLWWHSVSDRQVIRLIYGQLLWSILSSKKNWYRLIGLLFWFQFRGLVSHCFGGLAVERASVHFNSKHSFLLIFNITTVDAFSQIINNTVSFRLFRWINHLLIILRNFS